MIYIVLGPPGSGKGTQAGLLSKKLGVPAISMGEIMRQAREADTTLGNDAAMYMNEGKLVPRELVMSLMRFRLREDDCQNGFVLDGAPRRVEEAVLLDDFLRQEQKEIKKVILLEVSDNEVINRLLKRFRKSKNQGGQRKDDNINDIKVRLSEYNGNIKGIKVYYSNKDCLLFINGEQTIEDVHRDICNILQV